MNRNQSLYVYGLNAKAVEFLGGLLAVGSIFLSFIHPIFIVGIILGVIIIFKGKAMRFDYQRQSGTIIHGGDGFGR